MPNSLGREALGIGLVAFASLSMTVAFTQDFRVALWMGGGIVQAWMGYALLSRKRSS